jgi:putative Holliday junction resolvase
MKVLALDLGDVWTGTALSDGLKMFARPYKTVKTEELSSFLKTVFAEERIEIVVVGLPQTLKGTQSDQTRKTISYKESLESAFPKQVWVLWDERLTSKHAQQLKNPKDDKQKIHSLAAALILESYLMHLEFKKMNPEIQ